MTIMLSLGSIGLMELEIMAFVISVPIPVPFPIPIPMLRFQCRDLQMAAISQRLFLKKCLCYDVLIVFSFQQVLERHII